MSITFNSVPPDLRVPFTAIEFDSSRAVRGPTKKPFKALILGDSLEDSKGKRSKTFYIPSEEKAIHLFGLGSTLHQATKVFKQNSPTTELYAMALEPMGEQTTEVLEAVEVHFSNAISGSSGQVELFKVGVHPVSLEKIAYKETGASIARKVRLYFAKHLKNTLPFKLDTAKAKEETDKVFFIPTRADLAELYEFTTRKELWNYTGITVTITPHYRQLRDKEKEGEGTLEPHGCSVQINKAIKAMGDNQYDVVIYCGEDLEVVRALDQEMIRRSHPMVQSEGIVYMGLSGPEEELIEKAKGFNSRFICLIGHKGFVSKPFEVATAVGAQVAKSAAIDPARPFQHLPLHGIHATTHGFTIWERNGLLHHGIATLKVSHDGTPFIERLITTYQRNEMGSPDVSYLDVTTAYTLGFLRYDLRNSIERAFPRAKLANDGGPRLSPGQVVVTPKTLKAFIIGKFESWQQEGLVENIEQFVGDLIVERNGMDPNRMDVLMSPDLINSLIVTGVKIAFVL